MNNIIQTLTDEERQAIGAEMNLSETAFVEPLTAGDQFNKGAVHILSVVLEMN